MKAVNNRGLRHKFAEDEKAVNPAISTTILTSITIVLILVAVTFANSYLNARMAENEFGAMKQFMQTIGLQIDSVAWIIGSTQTVRYASKFGQVSFHPPIFLNYSVYINGNSTADFSYVTRILMFNMPTDVYNAGKDYYERIFPSTDNSFLQSGISAPVSYVYAIEKLPMYDGSFVRIVVAPCIRTLNSTVSTGGGVNNYTKMYLPILVQKSQLSNTQSVTLTGSGVSVKTQAVTTIRVTASFPNASLGFDASFFKFNSTTLTPALPGNSIVEFYTGKVAVSLGL